MDIKPYSRSWFEEKWKLLVGGWHPFLKSASDSGAVWETPRGIRTETFLSRSGKQCDGVTRMLPALAAWASEYKNKEEVELSGGARIRPKDLIRNALVHGTDPEHPDFWDDPPTDKANQRQVESSLVAWSLWLSREWLLPILSGREKKNIQDWLSSCTKYRQYVNNYSLFGSVNQAVRIALGDRGFSGEPDALRRALIIGDELHMGDGWIWDAKWSGIEYYNFWVWGSHHCYLKAMLPDLKNPALDRALSRFSERLSCVPLLVDSRGQNILFGRSLAYRWAWLNGLSAAHFIGLPAPDPGLSRAVLGRNLERWLDVSLNEDGVLRERLTEAGTDAVREDYINCGHPYWGMQAFLVLALDPDHAYWKSETKSLPVEQGSFQTPCQGPGLVFQGISETGEVRLWNLRNQDHAPNALYEKWVYSTVFFLNAGSPGRQTLWDSQFGIRGPNGERITPQLIEVDTNDGRTLHLNWRFMLENKIHARVETTILVEGECYESTHEVEVRELEAAGFEWIEGGFNLGIESEVALEKSADATSAWAKLKPDGKYIFSGRMEGWEALEVTFSEANIIEGKSIHHVLRAPVKQGTTTLRAFHGASLRASRIQERCEKMFP
ncbi:MAG: DUF2264 domain-containing protein [Spirochaetia bacterium]|nr:DUF2264 domain-containing protein [Spirochaetia bacterium]